MSSIEEPKYFNFEEAHRSPEAMHQEADILRKIRSVAEEIDRDGEQPLLKDWSRVTRLFGVLPGIHVPEGDPQGQFVTSRELLGVMVDPEDPLKRRLPVDIQVVLETLHAWFFPGREEASGQMVHREAAQKLTMWPTDRESLYKKETVAADVAAAKQEGETAPVGTSDKRDQGAEEARVSA